MKLFSKKHEKEEVKSTVATPTVQMASSDKPSLGELAKKMEQLYKKKHTREFHAGVSGGGIMFQGTYIGADDFTANLIAPNTLPAGTMTVNSTTGEYLVYNGNNWTATPFSGGAGGSGYTEPRTLAYDATTSISVNARGQWQPVQINRSNTMGVTTISINGSEPMNVTSGYVQTYTESPEQRRRREEQEALANLRRSIDTETEWI